MPIRTDRRPASGLDGAPRVLLLTEAGLPDLTDDDAPLLAAFRDAGWDAGPAVWSGPLPDADLAIVRSTWDYAARPAEFLTTLDGIAARMPIWNPVETVRWNSDKRYLLELSSAGVPLPPSTVVPQGSSASLDRVLADLGCDEVVVKPVVGAGGYRTWRATAATKVQWAAAVQSHDLLVQQYIPEVASAGEWSLVFLGGSFSHAVVKHPAGGEFRVQEQHGGTWRTAEPEAAMIAAGERVLAAIPHPWRYARVDGVPVGGDFLLMEAELIEPQLFLPTAPGAAQRLVAAVT